MSKIKDKHEKKAHAIIRARQRYHLRLNNADFFSIQSLIHQGKATLIERYGFKANWIVPYKERLLVVVYDEVKRRIVTFLPDYVATSYSKPL